MITLLENMKNPQMSGNFKVVTGEGWEEKNEKRQEKVRRK